MATVLGWGRRLRGDFGSFERGFAFREHGRWIGVGTVGIGDRVFGIGAHFPAFQVERHVAGFYRVVLTRREEDELLDFRQVWHGQADYVLEGESVDEADLI